MIKLNVTDESRALPAWLLLVAFLLLLPTVGMFAPSAYAADDEPSEESGATATEEEEPVEEKADLPWVLDVAAAKKQAAEEGKDIFINFTGSDWCGWCKKLHSEVFDYAAFVDAATKDFVFLFLDFPRAEDLWAKVVDRELNEKLKDAYGVAGFPTIILTKADGTPYARASYQKGGPENYLEYLAGFKASSEAVAKLLADTSHEDIEALKAAFPVIAEQQFLGWPAFAWMLDAAEKADPNGDLGLLPVVQAERTKLLAKTEWEEFVKLLPKSREEKPDFDKILPAILELEHQAGSQFLQFAINMTVGLMKSDRPEDAKKLLDHIKDDPFFEQEPRAQKVLDQVTADVDALLAGDDDEDDEDDDEEDDDEDEDDDDEDGGMDD